MQLKSWREMVRSIFSIYPVFRAARMQVSFVTPAEGRVFRDYVWKLYLLAFYWNNVLKFTPWSCARCDVHNTVLWAWNAMASGVQSCLRFCGLTKSAPPRVAQPEAIIFDQRTIKSFPFDFDTTVKAHASISSSNGWEIDCKKFS